MSSGPGPEHDPLELLPGHPPVPVLVVAPEGGLQEVLVLRQRHVGALAGNELCRDWVLVREVRREELMKYYCWGQTGRDSDTEVAIMTLNQNQLEG